MPRRSNWGNSFFTISTSTDSCLTPFLTKRSRVFLVKFSHSLRKVKSPVVTKRRILRSRPHSSSHAFQRWIERLAHCIHRSPSGGTLSPYELRTPRVSSPDVEREFPGP